MCRVTFRCVTAWSFCELHQCVTTGAGDGVVHQQRLQLPMGKRCAFGRNVKLMRFDEIGVPQEREMMRNVCSDTRKQGTIRNTRSKKKNGATGSEIIWCKSLASSELRATSVQHRATMASLGTRPVNRSKRTSIVQYAGSASVAKW